MEQQMRQASFATRTLVAALLLTATVARAELCGDLHGDGVVDAVDLRGYVLADFGCTGGDCVGDVDGDGDTDQQDLAWVLTYYGCEIDSPCAGPCEPVGTGTIDVDLVQVDNTSIKPGDDDHAPDFDGGVTHFTFDLVITVTADSDWTTQRSFVELMYPAVFFHHTFGGDGEPHSALLPLFLALEFDSFYAAPPETFDGWVGFARGPQWTDTSAEATWFDTPFLDDNTATTQRFTLVVSEGVVPAVLPDDCAHDFVVLAQLSTEVTAASTGADLLDYGSVIVDLAQPTCPGDADGDGDVDQSDLGILMQTYGRSSDEPDFDPHADFDCDGDVDQSDLGILLAVYGKDC